MVRIELDGHVVGRSHIFQLDGIVACAGERFGSVVPNEIIAFDTVDQGRAV